MMLTVGIGKIEPHRMTCRPIFLDRCPKLQQLICGCAPFTSCPGSGSYHYLLSQKLPDRFPPKPDVRYWTGGNDLRHTCRHSNCAADESKTGVSISAQVQQRHPRPRPQVQVVQATVRPRLNSAGYEP